MRVAVLGAGIVGVTTAYELTADGHEVSVIERRGGVASEASFAHAGVVAPGNVTPWAAPGMNWKLLRQLGSRDATLRLNRGALAQLPWLWRWWRACHLAVHGANRTALWQLARYSRDRLLELTRLLALDYEQAPGYLMLLRGERELAQSRSGLKLLADLGVNFELLDAERARRLEPGLNPDTPLRAAIHLPQDSVGNCRQFAQLLKAEAQQRGAHFRFDTAVRELLPGTRPGISTAQGEERFDALVVCAGAAANSLIGPLGLRLPLMAVHGYSVTAPLRHVDGYPDIGPRAAVLDTKHQVTVSRLGQRVRVSGGAEIGGSQDRYNDAALATLYRVLDDWFPGAATMPQAQRWKGARPMLPDGPPVLGASGAPGVWLNLGHGDSGWALACGSARVLADLVAGRASPIDMNRLGIERLR